MAPSANGTERVAVEQSHGSLHPTDEVSCENIGYGFSLP